MSPLLIKICYAAFTALVALISYYARGIIDDKRLLRQFMRKKRLKAIDDLSQYTVGFYQGHDKDNSRQEYLNIFIPNQVFLPKKVVDSTNKFLDSVDTAKNTKKEWLIYNIGYYLRIHWTKELKMLKSVNSMRRSMGESRIKYYKCRSAQSSGAPQ